MVFWSLKPALRAFRGKISNEMVCHKPADGTHSCNQGYEPKCYDGFVFCPTDSSACRDKCPANLQTCKEGQNYICATSPLDPVRFEKH